MARGRLLRTKVKEALKVSEATELGKAKGKLKAHQKKPWEESLKEHIGHWIDNIDPLEVVAIAGSTILIHSTILGSADLLGRVVTHLKSTKGQTSLVGDLILAPLFGFAGIYTAAGEWYSKAFAEESDLTVTQQQDLYIWLLSFTFSFIIVRHGEQILGLGQNITALLGMLLAA